MRVVVITAIAILTTCIGCKQYMRYRADADVTPLEARTSGQYLTTDDYLRLGMILQKELGRPYTGRSKWEAGIDCSAYTREAFQSFNSMQLPRTVEEQFKVGKEVSRNRMKFGDLVFFRTARTGVSHVGVFIGDGMMLHHLRDQLSVREHCRPNLTGRRLRHTEASKLVAGAGW